MSSVLCAVFPELSLHPFGGCALRVIAVGLKSADQALLDPPLVSVTYQLGDLLHLTKLALSSTNQRQ